MTQIYKSLLNENLKISKCKQNVSLSAYGDFSIIIKILSGVKHKHCFSPGINKLKL